MCASSCLLLAIMHGLIWARLRTRSNGIFAALALSTCLSSVCELAMMRSATPAEYGSILRWSHIPYAVMIGSLVWFNWARLQAGRPWLGWSVIGLRAVALILNFIFEPNVNYREITDLRPTRFLGEIVSVPVGTPNTWMLIGHAGLVLLVIFLADSAITIWRRRDPWSARVLSAAISGTVLLQILQALLFFWAPIAMPLFPSLLFATVVLVMGFELSWDVTRASKLVSELQESEARFRSLSEASLEGLAIHEKGIILDANLAFARLFGYDRAEDMIGKNAVTELLSPESHPLIFERWKRQSFGVIEVIGVRKDGSTFIGETESRLIKHRGREGRIVSMHDVTERKKAQDEMRRAQAFLQASMDCSTACIAIADAPDGKLRYVNDAALRMGGGDPKKLIDGVDIDLYVSRWKLMDLTGKPLPVEEVPMVRAIRFGETCSRELIMEPTNGDKRTVFVNGAPIRDQTGKVVAGIVVFTDVTDQRRAQSKLLESEERLRLAHKAANDVVWDWDAINDTQKWNEAGAVVFGWTEIVEKAQSAHWWVERVHPDDLKRVSEGFYAVVKNPKAELWRDEYRFRKADGNYAEVMDRGYVLRDKEGKAVRMIGAMLDITERKAAEIAKDKMEREFRAVASQLMRLQDEERRRIGRDLHDSTGQTLAALEINLGMLLRQWTSPEPRLKKLLEECVQLAGQCTGEIRTTSYLLHPPLLDEIGLSSALRWYADGFTKRSGIAVALTLPETPQRFAPEMELSLFRVVQEALVNIHRHSGSTTASIRLDHTNGKVTLEVADQGKGIDPETLRLFHEGHSNLGVGISGMRERIRQLGGELLVESNHTGATVRALLPNIPA